MSAVLTEIVGLLTSGLTAFGTGIGAGIQNFVSALFLDTSGASPVLSTFGGVVVIFAAVALCVGITAKIFQWIASLGANK